MTVKDEMKRGNFLFFFSKNAQNVRHVSSESAYRLGELLEIRPR